MKPGFIGIGVSKSGTSLFCEILRNIDIIFISEKEELSFFNNYNYFFQKFFFNKKKKIEWYLSNFETAKSNQICGEFSNIYFHDREALKRIKKFNKDIKVVIILRNPIYMIFSLYKYLNSSIFFLDTKKKISKKNIRSSSNDFLNLGNYYPNLSYAKKIFGKNLHIIFFEEFISNKKKTIKKFINFLGLHYKSKQLNKIQFEKKINSEKFVKNETVFVNLKKIVLFLNKIPILDKFFFYISSKKITYTLMNFLLLKRNRNLQLEKKDKEYLKKYYSKNVQKMKQLLDSDLKFWKEFQ